jgi:hypothetical protein
LQLTLSLQNDFDRYAKFYLWLSLGLGGMGISMGMSWAAANDIGRNFAGTVSGWMNLCTNISP